MDTVRQVFWIASLGVIAVFAFFAALGAVDPLDALAVTLVVVALSLLWVVHALLEHRHVGVRDPRALLARERRGF